MPEADARKRDVERGDVHQRPDGIAEGVTAQKMLAGGQGDRHGEAAGRAGCLGQAADRADVPEVERDQLDDCCRGGAGQQRKPINGE